MKNIEIYTLYTINKLFYTEYRIKFKNKAKFKQIF